MAQAQQLLDAILRSFALIFVNTSNSGNNVQQLAANGIVDFTFSPCSNVTGRQRAFKDVVGSGNAVISHAAARMYCTAWANNQRGREPWLRVLAIESLDACSLKKKGEVERRPKWPTHNHGTRERSSRQGRPSSCNHVHLPS